MELLDKTIDRASNKLYGLVNDKINSRISYKENDDGELEFIVNEEMMAEVLAELQTENEVFRKLTE